MASISRCFKSAWFDRALRFIASLVFLCVTGYVQAQGFTEIAQFGVERVDDDVLVSAQVLFELPTAVEEALIKGVAMYFVAEVDILRERWYWYDRRISAVQRHMRLSYQPLTRRWRLNVTSAANRDGNVGLTLNQSFDTLEQALSAIKRVSRWKVADAADLDASLQYKVDLHFRLDLSQLPRPFQIGALGQADWNIGAFVSTSLSLDVKR
jgi:hypothetical protein